jgi:hypothetical protein
MTSAPLIELHRVSKSFDGGRGFAVNDGFGAQIG